MEINYAPPNTSLGHSQVIQRLKKFKGYLTGIYLFLENYLVMIFIVNECAIQIKIMEEFNNTHLEAERHLVHSHDPGRTLYD